MICVVVGVFIGLLLFKDLLIGWWKGTNYAFLANLIPSVINAVQIHIFNSIFGRISEFLTNFENHETHTSYERSLILKTFAF